MRKKSIVKFWNQTSRNYKSIDVLRLVYADKVCDYDTKEQGDLFSILKGVLKKCLDVEVRVSTQRVVTFIATVDERIFDL